MFLTKRKFMLLAVAVLLSSCSLRSPPEPDRLTKHFNTDITLNNKQITLAKPIKLSQYKILIVRSSLPFYEEYYVVGAIKNLNIINEVQTTNSIRSLLVADRYDDVALSQLTSTEYGLKKLDKIYGKFLILDIKLYPHGISADVFCKAYDPADGKIYFSASCVSQGVLLTYQKVYHPLLNALSDWAQQSTQ